MLRVEQLRDKGIVSRDVQRYGEYDELDSTIDNWYLYEQRKRGRTAGNYGFVALRFDNEELKVFLDTVGLMIEKAFWGRNRATCGMSRERGSSTTSCACRSAAARSCRPI